MTMSTREKAMEIYNKHIALAATDGRLFRKTVLEELMTTTGCTLASSATHYNNCKKSAPVEGLGRAPVSKNVRRPGGNGKTQAAVQDDDECYTVIELLKHKDGVTVGRCRSHLMQGDASEDFDDRIKWSPVNEWVMIKGLGPLHGETFKLNGGEEEINRYTPEVVAVVEHDEPLLPVDEAA